MNWTRDDISSYEKLPAAVVPDPVTGKMPAAAAAAPDPAPVEAPAAADPSPAVDSDPAVPDDASSGEIAESPTAADPQDGDPTPTAEATKGRTIPMDRFEAVNDEKNALKAYGKLKDAESEQLRAEIARLQGKTPTSAAEQPAAAAPALATDPMPTLASVNYDEAAFQTKMTDWVRREAKRTAQAEVETARQTDTAARIRSDYTAREATFAAKHPDYNTVVNNPALPKLVPATARQIVTAEDGPAIIYHLGKNPDEAVRLSRLGPEAQLMRLGEIRSKIAAADAAPASGKPATPAQKTAQRNVTKAPPPPTPTPAGASNGSKDPNSMSMEEFVANERGRKVKEREDRRRARGLRV